MIGFLAFLAVATAFEYAEEWETWKSVSGGPASLRSRLDCSSYVAWLPSLLTYLEAGKRMYHIMCFSAKGAK